MKGNLLTSLWKKFTFTFTLELLYFFPTWTLILLRFLALLKPIYVYYLKSKFVWFGVVDLSFGRCFGLFGFSFCCFFPWGSVWLVLAEVMTERADEIVRVRGTKGVYKRHAKNIEWDISELMKNLTFNNEIL